MTLRKAWRRRFSGSSRCVPPLPRMACANGAEFFEAQQDGPPVLYYFGNVKDTAGNVLDKVMVTIAVKRRRDERAVPQ